MYSSYLTRNMIFSVLFVFGILAISLLLGFISSTGSVAVVIIVSGMIFGSVLLFQPKIMIWILLIFGLFSGFIVSSLGQGSGGINWLTPLLSFALLIPSVFAFLWQKNIRYPSFFWMIVVLFLYSLIISIINWHGIYGFLSGFKHYFQMYGLFLALAVLLVFEQKDFERWKRALLVIAALQLPFALYEFLYLVPLRGGLGGIAVTDVVAGTFGANLEGGSPNSVMAVFLIIASMFVFNYYKNSLISVFTLVVFIAIFLSPIFLGEVKIAILLIPLSVLILYRREILISPIKMLPLLLMTALFTFVLGYVYVVVIMESTLIDVIDGALSYNFGSEGYSQGQYLNRMTSIIFWFDNNVNQPVSLLFGNGLSSSYYSEGYVGHIARLYPNSGINLTTLSTLLWDLGLFGALIFYSIFFLAWKCSGFIDQNNYDMKIKSDVSVIQVAIVLMVLMSVYSNALVNLYSMQIIYTFLLGYLVFLYKKTCNGSSLC